MLMRSLTVAAGLMLAVPALAQEAAPADTAKTETKYVEDVVLGEADAPVTVIEYASFTCGHCAAFHESGLPKLKEDYIDTGKVKFIQRDVYFDAVGMWAGVLARCGGDDKYYAVSDVLFEEQKEWLSGSAGDEIAANLRKIGLKTGLTEEKMEACWNDKAMAESLIATFQKNATADKIEATPTFIIGDEKVQGNDWDKVKEAIDAQLAE